MSESKPQSSISRRADWHGVPCNEEQIKEFNKTWETIDNVTKNLKPLRKKRK